MWVSAAGGGEGKGEARAVPGSGAVLTSACMARSVSRLETIRYRRVCAALLMSTGHGGHARARTRACTRSVSRRYDVAVVSPQRARCIIYFTWQRTGNGVTNVVQPDFLFICRYLLGHVSLALENEVGHLSIFSILKDGTLFCFGCNNWAVPKLCL